MDWTKVITHPLGVVGLSLWLIFNVVGIVLKKKGTRIAGWLVPGFFALAVICVVGGFVLAYQHQEAAVADNNGSTLPNTASLPASMDIGKIEQKVENGSAVAGVQGNVISEVEKNKSSKPSH